jgi:hypothetical protein
MKTLVSVYQYVLFQRSPVHLGKPLTEINANVLHANLWHVKQVWHGISKLANARLL